MGLHGGERYSISNRMKRFYSLRVTLGSSLFVYADIEIVSVWVVAKTKCKDATTPESNMRMENTNKYKIQEYRR